MIEEWHEIKGNREIYEVSNYGNIRTKDRIGARNKFCKGHTLHPYKNYSGYFRVHMNIEGKGKEHLENWFKTKRILFSQRKPSSYAQTYSRTS